jgi:D-alanine-D-alanine ligase
LFIFVLLRDYARFDLRAVTDGQLRHLDANPNATWYTDSRMAMMAQWSGYSYANMLKIILDAAVQRYGLR